MPKQADELVDVDAAMRLADRFGLSIKRADLPGPDRVKEGRKLWRRPALMAFLTRQFREANPTKGVFINGITHR